MPRRSNKSFVYRVENYQGEGPYTSLGHRYWSDRSHDDDNHPSPQGESLNIYKEGYICGFISLRQLNDWFNQQELKKLKELGYTIHKVTPKKGSTLVGKKQAIFIRGCTNA